jgi:hypothetical protein
LWGRDIKIEIFAQGFHQWCYNFPGGYTDIVTETVHADMQQDILQSPDLRHDRRWPLKAARAPL